MSEPLTEDSIEARQRMARLAISELFLDTELDQNDFARLRDVLKASRLTVAELDRIYYKELAPMLYGNLDTTAGEWSGFDPEWIEREISKQVGQRIIEKVPLLNRVWQHWITRTTREEWQKLKWQLDQPRSRG